LSRRVASSAQDRRDQEAIVMIVAIKDV